ncbi:hypothetical protein MLD38_013148 [Melastoma candidum]|uniref:Uncharacterized protein n=1 Tax=Melastoma candidum TaxID=119954 RepID=A0ACB9R813_9MYRT|nr:hypothetical protein MLD38_013148 [Melastoma candidum]
MVTPLVSSSNVWKTPIPYLFSGLGAVVVLISVALILLACSCRKCPRDPADEKPPSGSLALRTLDPEPRIVVVMAGDDVPSYIARPAPRKHPAPWGQDHCCCNGYV